jgi:cytochrome c oxidase subunit II
MSFNWLPEAASSISTSVDNYYFYLIAVSLFFTVLVFALVLSFSVKFQRRSETETGREVHASMWLEVAWSVIPLIIAMTMFVWATYLFFANARPPKDAVEMFVVGKQWMWKIQHPDGRREINELHVPVGQAVRLTMTSEDVIHSFYIPAFRVKMDVLPGRYSRMWFKPTKAGKYHLFCAEYCGTNHSRMIGSVIVMEPAHYQAWLDGRQPGASTESMVTKGEKLFKQFNCISCHGDASRAPLLEGIFGKEVQLEGGRTIKADENYLRESIVLPASKIVKGYAPTMPLYASQMNEEQVMQLLAYLKADLGSQKGAS